jgi:hypothetical protein
VSKHLQITASGAGNLAVTLWPNVIDAKYPYSIPGGLTLTDPSFDDYYRPLNCKGNRLFIELSIANDTAAYFEYSKSILIGRQDAWSPLNPVGGGNVGIASTQQ